MENSKQIGQFDPSWWSAYHNFLQNTFLPPRMLLSSRVKGGQPSPSLTLLQCLFYMLLVFASLCGNSHCKSGDIPRLLRVDHVHAEFVLSQPLTIHHLVRHIFPKVSPWCQSSRFGELQILPSLCPNLSWCVTKEAVSIERECTMCSWYLSTWFWVLGYLWSSSIRMLTVSVYFITKYSVNVVSSSFYWPGW